MAFMDRHAFAVTNNPRSMDASTTPPYFHQLIFYQCPPMSPTSITPARSNVHQTVSSQPTVPPINSDMFISEITAMETFQLDIDNVKEDVQELKTGMKSTQKMLQHLITPT
jgi:hypothetical protein